MEDSAASDPNYGRAYHSWSHLSLPEMSERQELGVAGRGLYEAEKQHSQGKQILAGQICPFHPEHRRGALHEVSYVHPQARDGWERPA